MESFQFNLPLLDLHKLQKILQRKILQMLQQFHFSKKF